MTDTAAGLSRRERKKRETRAALHRAAMGLFAQKGFRATRVSEIAEAADVAEATFFRHFASKEEVALVDLMARIDSTMTALEARPDHEGPLDACAALVDTPEGMVLTPGPDELVVVGLMVESSSLSGYFFGQMTAVAGRMAREFGRRMGLAHTDLRPQLLASSVIGALNAVLLTWLSDPLGTSTNELSRRAFAHLAEGMAWPSTLAEAPATD